MKVLPCDVKGLTTLSAMGGLGFGFGGGGWLVDASTSGRGFDDSVDIVERGGGGGGEGGGGGGGSEYGAQGNATQRERDMETPVEFE